MVQRLPFYRDLTDDERNLLQSEAYVASVQKNSGVQRGGAPCFGMFMILSGKTAVSMLSEEGREITLYRPTAGECCVMSTACVMQQLELDFHLTAEEDTELLVVPANTMSVLMQNNRKVSEWLFRTAVSRFSEMMNVMQRILFCPVEKRIAVFLLEESVQTESHTLYLTHEQIARMTGSAREVVTRTLRRFAASGLLVVHRGKITLIDRDRIRSLAE